MGKIAELRTRRGRERGIGRVHMRLRWGILSIVLPAPDDVPGGGAFLCSDNVGISCFATYDWSLILQSWFSKVNCRLIGKSMHRK
jgi:hypothetical protein